MARKIVSIIALFSLFFLASCAWDPGGFKAQDKWLSQQKEAQKQYEMKVKREHAEQVEREQAQKIEYQTSHPEVSIGTLPLDSKSKSANEFRKAINEMNFVTREPSSGDLNQSYVKIGRFHFSFKRFVISINAQSEECKRVSAYSGENLDELCKQQMSTAIQDFASVLKNPEINDLTKWSALNEASYGNFIDYEHASRLAVMHHKLCSKQGNRGYVEMVTSAVPCNDNGDILNSYTARKLGLISN